MRASTATCTALAPASRSTLAHSEAVAPVVITSSTRRRVLPSSGVAALTAKRPWTLKSRAEGERVN